MRRWSVFAVVVALLLLAGSAVASAQPTVAQDGEEALYRIQGTVTTADGAPVQNLWVGAHPHRDPRGKYEAEQSGPQGSFEIQIPAGTYLLHIHSDTFGVCTVSGYGNAESRARAVLAMEDGDATGLGITVREAALERAVWTVCTFEVVTEMVTTELQPGWNLAGWTEAEADVSAIFDAIPQLEAAYAWDAGAQSFLGAVRLESGIREALSTLTPGMGLWLHIGGTERFIWSRTFLPASGIVSLSEGWNLVGWGGADGVAPEDALTALGNDLEAAAEDAGSLQRGDGLWVRTSSERHWLQPESARPTMEFSADYSDARQGELRTLVDTAVAFFAHRFDIFVPGLTVRYAGPDSPNECSFGNSTIYLEDICAIAIAHEYSHAIQEYLAPSVRRGPAWLIEGIANHWSAQFHEARGFRTYESHLEKTTRPLARKTSVPLQSMDGTLDVDGLIVPNYNIAHVAIDFLIDLTGEDRTFEYHSRRSQYESWEAAFQGVFGLTVADFYEKFTEYRAAHFPPYPLTAGTVVDHEGNPLAGVRVHAISQEGQPGGSMTTGDDGTFSLQVRDGAYLLTVHTHEQENARHVLWYAGDGEVALHQSEATTLHTARDDITGITVTIPDLTWYRIAGVVLGPDGTGLGGIDVDAFPTGEYPATRDETDEAGAFNIVVLGGSFGLHLYADTPGGRIRIGTYLGEGRYSPLREDMATVHIAGKDVTGITIQLPVDPSPSQWRRIEGVVIGPNGEPQEGITVDAYPNGEAPGHVDRTDKNGAFSVLVLPGPFKLVLTLPGGGGHYWYDGVIQVGGEDVRGITIKLPPD